jgi:EAL domain-containing protein (putative c-di-GMP-specific phosphodiesterase class I)/PleD family two-component response regulator
MNQFTAKTVLIADDDPGQRLLVEAALAGAGFSVLTAVDGAAAVESYSRTPTDCVILDVMMPNLTGIEACRAIRERTDGRLLPILMLTGRNDLSAISEAYAAGASDFAQKGLNPRLLVERVRFLLRDRELQDQLWSSRSKLLLAQRIARVGHWEMDADGWSLDVSPFIYDLLDWRAHAIDRYDEFVCLLDPAEQDAVRTAFRECAAGKGGYSFDHRLKTTSGSEVCLHQEAELVAPAATGGGGVVIVTLQDTTRLRHAEEAVRTLSYFDAATGLPNQRYLVEHTALALKEDSTAQSGVVAFRLHQFDSIVQAEGARFANALIIQVARNIEAELTSAGLGGAIVCRSELPTVCRIGAGELGVLLRSHVSPEHLASVIRCVLTAISRPTLCLDTEFVPALSAGIALVTRHGSDAEQLLGNAHVAAQQAVDARSCEFFSSAPQVRSRRRLMIESALRGAIERREMHLEYQPRVAIDTLELTGVEALLRWEHEQFGAVPPEEFILIAEENGTIDEVGQWVLGEACRQAVRWREGFRRSFFVSVNLSGRQLRNAALVAQVNEALVATGLPPDALEIELTETSIVDAPNDARDKLAALRRMGVRIAIDDFGVGHSSLGQIRRLPFDCMKLDRALMADLYTDLGAQGIAAAVIAMARALRIRSVAEGVEDSATLAMLRALGCDEIQGYYVSHPLSAPDFEAWLSAGGAAALVAYDAVGLDAGLGSGESRIRRSKRGGR